VGNKLPTLHDYGAVWPMRWDTMTDMRRNALRLLRPTGLKVKNIRLAEGDHDIDCKIDGIGAMSLKSEFVKKV